MGVDVGTQTMAFWLIPTIGLLAILFAPLRYCRDWFGAAMWMQLALTLTAAACTTVVAPSLLTAKELLIGGKIMIAVSVASPFPRPFSYSTATEH